MGPPAGLPGSVPAASGSPFLLPEPGAGVLPEEGSYACIRARSAHRVRARSVLGPTLGTAPRPCAEHTPAGGPPLPPPRRVFRLAPPTARTHPQPAQPWQRPCPPRSPGRATDHMAGCPSVLPLARQQMLTLTVMTAFISAPGNPFGRPDPDPAAPPGTWEVPGPALVAGCAQTERIPRPPLSPCPRLGPRAVPGRAEPPRPRGARRRGVPRAGGGVFAGGAGS